MVNPDTIGLLEKAIMQADLLTGKRLVSAIAVESGDDALVFDVLEPILADLGERLKRQEASLAQSYVASLVVDEALRLHQAFRTPLATPGARETARKGPVVLANIEGDCHPLGRKIVSAFLNISNWNVCDLGVDVEASRIVDKAVEIWARVIGVSAMIFTTAENIRTVRQEIDARGLSGRIMLAVGGAVFRLRPELADQVGGDGTAPSAFSAAALFDELWQRAKGG